MKDILLIGFLSLGMFAALGNIQASTSETAWLHMGAFVMISLALIIVVAQKVLGEKDK